MKTSISSLPESKQNELKAVLDALQAFPDIDMVILFGSHATGKWVEDKYEINGITYEYKSDFDLLIIIGSNEKAASDSYTESIMSSLDGLELSTPVSPICHSIDFVNKKISDGNYFFNDIRGEGIMLYNSGRFNLANKRKLNRTELKANAERDFKNWFESANEFYDDFRSNLEKERYKKAAFELHQATERYYHTVLLVFTGYKPKTHDIDKLGWKVARFNPSFAEIFPRKTTEEKRLFTLLRKAYVDARYDNDYAITKQELEYLGQRVEKLRGLTEEICKKQIANF